MPGEADRAERERRAYDHGEVWTTSDRWHRRAAHVFECPNTRRHEALFAAIAARHAAGGRVLDIGCGEGESSRWLSSLGARRVLGIDVSERSLERARRGAAPGRLDFRLADAHEPLEGNFDLVFGRSVLHHLDYRPVVQQLYDSNLSPGGSMLFMEPMGSNLISFLYRILVPGSHTPDERPFGAADLRWLRRAFPDVVVHPFNYLSYPMGIVSSFVARDADNAALRAADRLDGLIARRLPFLASRFRQVILHVRKPAAGSREGHTDGSGAPGNGGER